MFRLGNILLAGFAVGLAANGKCFEDLNDSDSSTYRSSSGLPVSSAQFAISLFANSKGKYFCEDAFGESLSREPTGSVATRVVM